MRALTLTQPWAGLVASGLKLVENRPRQMIKREDFGKPFAIHASRVIDEPTYDRVRELAPELFADWDKLPASDPSFRWYRLSRITSAVIAVATIDDVIYDKSGMLGSDIARQLGAQCRWFFGPVGYVLRDVQALAEPVPCRGWQGFWTLQADTAAAVNAQLARAA